MYMLYLDHVLFPVAPEKIVIETKNSNKTYTLVDGSFVVDAVKSGPKKITFDLLLPMSKYPFAHYENEFIDGGKLRDKLNEIAQKGEYVWFDVYRTFPDMNKTYLTNIPVVVDYVKIFEDAKNGMDMRAEIGLTEYRGATAKTVDAKTSYVRKTGDLAVPYTYTVKEGDTLYLIAKKFYGSGEKYPYLAYINSIEPPYVIHPGDVLRVKE